MTGPFDISISISAGKKDLTVIPDNDSFILKESGSIVAVITRRDGGWVFSKGSYTESDAQKIGGVITKLQRS